MNKLNIYILIITAIASSIAGYAVRGWLQPTVKTDSKYIERVVTKTVQGIPDTAYIPVYIERTGQGTVRVDTVRVKSEVIASKIDIDEQNGMIAELSYNVNSNYWNNKYYFKQREITQPITTTIEKYIDRVETVVDREPFAYKLGLKLKYNKSEVEPSVFFEVNRKLISSFYFGIEAKSNVKKFEPEITGSIHFNF